MTDGTDFGAQALPAMSEETEKRRFERLRKSPVNELDALIDSILRSHIGKIAHVAFLKSPDDETLREDMVVAGIGALFTSIDVFDDRPGVRFWAYAHDAVEQAMMKIGRQSGTIRRPRSWYKLIADLRRKQDTVQCDKGHTVELRDLVEETRTKRSTLNALDAPRFVEYDDDIHGSPVNPESIMDEEEEKTALESAIGQLEPDVRMVIEGVFGVGSGTKKSVKQLCAEMGLKRFQIYRLRNVGLESLGEIGEVQELREG